MSTLNSRAQALHVNRDTLPPRRSFWRRFFDALSASRQRQADREIARYIRNQGGRFNDDLERRIQARMLRY